MAKHSIIIPVYNGEAYLRDCITSALAQSYADIEIIITDNCSTDATSDVALSFKDERIRYFRQSSNIGMVRNWNFGLSKIKSRSFQILCADDYLEKHHLERSLEFAGANTITFTNCTVLSDGASYPYENPHKNKKGISAFDLLRTMHGVPLSSVIFSRSDQIAEFDKHLEFNCDLEFIYRSMYCGNMNLHFIDEPLVNVRLHGANETLKFNHKNETQLAAKKMLRYTRSPALLMLLLVRLIRSR